VHLTYRRGRVINIDFVFIVYIWHLFCRLCGMRCVW